MPIGDPPVISPQPNYNVTYAFPWVCPVCGSVNGPTVMQWPCRGDPNYGTTTSDNTELAK